MWWKLRGFPSPLHCVAIPTLRASHLLVATSMGSALQVCASAPHTLGFWSTCLDGLTMVRASLERLWFLPQSFSSDHNMPMVDVKTTFAPEPQHLHVLHLYTRTADFHTLPAPPVLKYPRRLPSSQAEPSNPSGAANTLNKS